MTSPKLGIMVMLARGRAAYEAFLAERLNPADAPMGVASLNIVTRADFERHPGECLDFVTPTRVIHILSEHGQIFALLSRHRDPVESMVNR